MEPDSNGGIFGRKWFSIMHTSRLGGIHVLIKCRVYSQFETSDSMKNEARCCPNSRERVLYEFGPAVGPKTGAQQNKTKNGEIGRKYL